MEESAWLLQVQSSPVSQPFGFKKTRDNKTQKKKKNPERGIIFLIFEFHHSQWCSRNQRRVVGDEGRRFTDHRLSGLVIQVYDGVRACNALARMSKERDPIVRVLLLYTLSKTQGKHFKHTLEEGESQKQHLLRHLLQISVGAFPSAPLWLLTRYLYGPRPVVIRELLYHC